MIAAAAGHVDALRVLLMAGADANLQCTSGASPLLLAASGCHCGALSVLLEQPDLDEPGKVLTGKVRLLILRPEDVRTHATLPGPLCARTKSLSVRLQFERIGVQKN